ncbi:ABC transporter ATP-binding protein [Kiloniella laminariae]|uniref:ABC transporter ATP-binding protein n=1 Tax=Kiloniella laminariae TaxID=454162 RepID=A0ABT4LH83_9PROT|nr:ABC transporter ATP-binding protein [Kiloniella laminariae]MCZ4280449.1 ABC transporter ATP-binding protein [Kiloniella laminariae]
MSLLEIRNLSVEFETAHGLFRAVDSVDLEIDQGEMAAIVGESGSGKSVSMLALMGLLPWTARITADRMNFDGQDLLTISQKERRKIIGKDISMIFQEPMTSLNPCFTVGYQIMEVIKEHLGGTKKELEARAVELLGLVGIPAPESRLRAFPHQMSGGMNQRVMIAMMIACNPRLLIADEPTTALDVTIQAQILELLQDLQHKRGMALVLITHDMGVVAETAEVVNVQYAGQQVERQNVVDLFARPQHPYTHALLSALPERATGKRLPSIPGVVPGLLDRPTGCLFNPRCQFATDKCRSTPPALHSKVLCHYPLVDGKPTNNHPGVSSQGSSGQEALGGNV